MLVLEHKHEREHDTPASCPFPELSPETDAKPSSPHDHLHDRPSSPPFRRSASPPPTVSSPPTMTSPPSLPEAASPHRRSVSPNAHMAATEGHAPPVWPRPDEDDTGKHDNTEHPTDSTAHSTDAAPSNLTSSPTSVSRPAATPSFLSQGTPSFFWPAPFMAPQPPPPSAAAAASASATESPQGRGDDTGTQGLVSHHPDGVAAAASTGTDPVNEAAPTSAPAPAPAPATHTAQGGAMSSMFQLSHMSRILGQMHNP